MEKNQKSSVQENTKTSNVQPSTIKPSEVLATPPQPTPVTPTPIVPTPVTPTPIVPTEIQSGATSGGTGTLAKPKVGLYLGIFAVSAGLFLMSYLLTGLSLYLLLFAFFLVVDFVALKNEMNKIVISQEQVDQWNEKLKKQNYKGEPMKMEDFRKMGNRFSFWLHTKTSAQKVASIATALIAVLCIAAAPVLYFSGIGVGNVSGNTYEYGAYTYTFDEDQTYTQTYEGSVMDSGTWSQSGNKVTCESNGGITIVFTVGFSSIQSADGNTWQKT